MIRRYPIPNILWLAIVSLAVFGVLHVIVGFSSPPQFVAAAVNILLIFGLLRLEKWAFGLAIVASILGPILSSLAIKQYFYLVLVLNSTVLIPVLVCTRAFFPKHAGDGKSAGQPSS